MKRWLCSIEIIICVILLLGVLYIYILTIIAETTGGQLAPVVQLTSVAYM